MTSKVVAALSLLLLVSCSAQSSTPVSQVTTTAPPVATSTSTAPSESPSPTGASCPNVFDGGTCLGAIDAGRYQTQTLEPQLTYAVPAGWDNMEDLPGNFLLLPPGSKLSGVNPGTSDYLGVYSSVVAPGLCTGQPAADVAQTFDGLVGFLKSDPHLGVSNVRNVSVGALKGVVMDLVMKSPKGDGCSDGVWADIYVGFSPSSLVHSAIANSRTRVYLLRNGSDTLAIEVADVPRGSNYSRIGSARQTTSSSRSSSPSTDHEVVGIRPPAHLGRRGPPPRRPRGDDPWRSPAGWAGWLVLLPNATVIGLAWTITP